MTEQKTTSESEEDYRRDNERETHHREKRRRDIARVESRETKD